MSFSNLKPSFTRAIIGLSLATLLIPSTGSAQFFQYYFEGNEPPRKNQQQPQRRQAPSTQRQQPQEEPPQNWGRSRAVVPREYDDEFDTGNYGYGRPEPLRPPQYRQQPQQYQQQPRYTQPEPQPQRRQPAPQRGRPLQINPYSYDDDDRDVWTAPPQFPHFNPNPNYYPQDYKEEGETDKNKRELVEFRNQPRQSMPFYVTQAEWTEEQEKNFGLFLGQLGRAVRAKKYTYLREYMQDPTANAYAHTDPSGTIYYADCADFPYFLRAYYAFKNQLPMSIVTGVSVSGKPYSSPADRDADLEKARLDNSPYGNLITSRGHGNLPRSPGGEKNFINYLVNMFDIVSTRTFRVGALSPNYNMSDIYPVKLDSYGIRPGTIVHSTGHLLVVFEVDKKGVIHAIDAHPDGSVSYEIIKSSSLQRSRPDQGLGFFKFRPQRLVGYKKARNGALYGGKIESATDEQLYQQGLYSLDQWFGAGTNLPPASVVAPTQYQSAFKKPGFFDHLSQVLRDQNLVVSPDEDIESLLSSLCDEMQQRVKDVNTALTEKGTNLNLQAHPSELPSNIYSTSGLWEDLSTPGRDSRMKSSVYDIVKTAVTKYKIAKAGTDRGIKFAGGPAEYQTAIRGRLAAMDKKCSITYTKSNSAKQTLKFSQVVSRLNRLSFDPYHCAEKRWGASGEELKSCKDMDYNHVWYNAQAPMRNMVGKMIGGERYAIRSDRPITIQMLADSGLIDQPPTAPVNLGTKQVPLMNLDGYFASEQFLKDLAN